VSAAHPQGRREIVGLLERHDLRARKHLGQHFLADPNVVRRIVRVAGVGPGDRVVEVGVGTGTLTLALAATGARVRGYEVDERLRPVLAEVFEGLDTVEVRFEDALAADLAADLGEGPWTMVANLPYNVGTPLVVEVLRSVPAIVRLVVMLQKEVAARLVAAPGATAYGLPSVSVALRATAALAFTVGPQVFVPRPEVDSAVVVIERIAADPLAGRAEAVAAAAFNQRRKMVCRSLAVVLTDPAAVLESAGVDPEARAEDLAPADYLRIAAAVP
jgi:16S rRNA (adenine1518-N6/adenine1519-N6)-dimethyltransferase